MNNKRWIIGYGIGIAICLSLSIVFIVAAVKEHKILNATVRTQLEKMYMLGKHNSSFWGDIPGRLNHKYRKTQNIYYFNEIDIQNAVSIYVFCMCIIGNYGQCFYSHR